MSTMITGLMARPWVYGWELRKGINALVQSLASANKRRVLRVEWGGTQTAAVNGSGLMRLAAVADDARVSRALLVRYVGFVIHEVLHLVYTDFTVRNSAPYIDRLHNAVEDIWIERRGITSGLTGNIEAVLTDLVNQIVDESLAAVPDWTDPAQYPFVLAIWGRRYARKVPLAQGLQPIFDEASARIDQCKNSRDTLAVAEWVYTQLKAFEQPEQQPEQRPEQDSGQDGQDGVGEQGDQQEGQGDSSEGADGQGDSACQQSGQQADQRGKPVGKARAPGSSYDDAAPVEPSIKIEGKQEGVGISQGRFRPDGFHLTQDPCRDISVTVPAKLRYEVRRLFDNTGTTLFTPGRKSGSIHTGSLHKATLTDRVFQRRQDIEGIDSAVMLAIDCSGSMCMYEIEVASQVAYALIDALASAEVPCGIVTFDTYASLALPITTNKAKARDVCSRIIDRNDTDDAAAVRLAMDVLLPRTESRKVIFVLTDGMGCIDQVQALCRSATALGITVIGVGIGTDVSAVYPQSVTIHNLRELGAVVFSQIKLAA